MIRASRSFARFVCGLLGLLGIVMICLSTEIEAAPWRSTGPEGGYVTVLHFPHGEGPQVLAGTYGGGVFHSLNWGESWTDITGNMSDYVLVDFVSAKGPFPRTWAATAEGIVYRSSSFNGIWDFASAGLGSTGPPQLTGLAVDPTDPLKLAASAFEGLWLTETAGAVWPDTIFINLGGAHTDVEITDRAPVRHYVAGLGEVWRSDDARHFDSLRQGLPVGGYMIDLEIWPGSVDSLLVAYLDQGLYLTQDGKNFRFIGPASNGANSPRLRKIEILAQSGEIFLCSEQALHYSDDLGVRWRIFEEPQAPQFPEYWSLLPLNPPQHEFLVGTFGRGVLRTRAEGEWSPQNRGLIATWITDLAVDGDLVLAATRNGRLHLSRDGGESWEDVTGNLESLGIMTVRFLSGGSRWLVGTLEGIWLSDDEGITWSRPRRGYPGTQAVFELLEVPATGAVYAGSLRGVYLSRDHGEEWKQVESLPQDRPFRVAAVDPQGRVWWGGDPVGLWRAEPGQAFEPMDLGAGSPVARIRGLEFDPTIPDLVYWASTRELYRWLPQEGSVAISLGLPETNVKDLLVLPGGLLAVALRDEGVFVSESNGDAWLDWNEGLEPTRPTALAYRAANSPVLLSGTFAKGVFLKDLLALGVRGTGTLGRVSRVTNQPNPFNPRTLVSFWLESPSLARVEVFDQRGRRVALLHQGPLPAGEVELSWDARDARGRELPSGVYHVRINAEGEKQSLPVTLLR